MKVLIPTYFPFIGVSHLELRKTFFHGFIKRCHMKKITLVTLAFIVGGLWLFWETAKLAMLPEAIAFDQEVLAALRQSDTFFVILLVLFNVLQRHVEQNRSPIRKDKSCYAGQVSLSPTA